MLTSVLYEHANFMLVILILLQSVVQELLSAGPSKRFGTESDSAMRKSAIERQRVSNFLNLFNFIIFYVPSLTLYY